MNQDWMNNPALKNISPEKLEMLQSLAAQGSMKDKNSLLPFLMNAGKTTKKKGMGFTSEEMKVILDTMKVGKTPAEVAKMEKLVNLMSMMGK